MRKVRDRALWPHGASRERRRVPARRSRADLAFDFSNPTSGASPKRVYMGETVTWKNDGTDFIVHNLRSFQTGACDDYWNWAYTIYAAPK